MERRRLRVAVLATVAALCAALAGTASARVDARGHRPRRSSRSASSTRRPAVSRPSAKRNLDGFRAGLAYTKGKCGGYTINPTYIDDATDPATAIAAFKNQVGQGVKIIAGTASSGIALQLGPLAAQNNVLYITSGARVRRDHRPEPEHVPRRPADAARTSSTRANIFPPKSAGKKVVVFAEDTAFGQGNVAAVKAIFGSKGHTVSKILSPFGAADLTPYAQQLKNSNADAAFVAWANTTNSAAMWQALQQQGVSKQMTLDHRSREPRDLRRARAARAGRDARLALRLQARRRTTVQHVPDQVVREEPARRAEPLHAGRLRHGADDLPGAAEGRHRHGEADQRARGLAVPAPKGKQRIRAADHAMIQPMFQAQLVPGKDGHFAAKVTKTVSPGNVQPPVTPFK